MELTHDHFVVIYKILSALEANMDTGQPIDEHLFNAEALGISRERFFSYLEMLSDSGYIKGAELTNYIRSPIVHYSNAKITLKGLEYLAENTIMQRIYKTVKGVAEIVK